MPSSHIAEPLREPTFMDEFGGRHHPPKSAHPNMHHSRYEHPSGPRRRAQTYRAPRALSPSSSSSDSPPPRHHRHRRSPRRAPRPVSPEPIDNRYEYMAPRRRHPREEDYFSDNRYNRPGRDPYGYHHHHSSASRDRPRRDDRERRARPRAEPRSKPEKKESVWQKEAKEMFKEYAVPVIKAETGKIITKQIGNLIAKRTS
ncbi:hypothetical protein DM02DRAFT_662288 [Periconia macrospinosa]|uniref:Uncharacterized protein n=1 Tax=Periconia macrospinosa TaxID=97972 RepID=A0A2V1D6B5_9PLEO|nr:hypothetical protein DM02DRAFT_662288 [Periconia macrospinosa]